MATKMQIEMKRTIIFSVIASASALLATSCMKIDNFKEPESRLHGTVYDAHTGQPILQDQGHTRIRIFEMSFPNRAHQEIPIKQDGTYNNQRLFPGHYDMVPLGAWWPADTVRVALGKNASQDFQVVPYLRVLDFEATLTGLDLNVSCRLQAPEGTTPPQIQDVRAFVSMNQFCGADHKIDAYNNNSYRIVRSPTNWSAFEKAADGATTTLSTSTPLRLKAGYTYFVRIGATVKDDTQGNKYNYSEIKTITVPY